MMHRNAGSRLAWGMIVGIALGGAGDARAQGTLPFRPGQWGAEFTVRNQAVGTLLRFHTPERAWAFGGEAVGSFSDSNAGSQSNAAFSLSLALRRYRPLAPGVVGYWALGGQAGLARDRVPNSSRLSLSLGPVAQVGAAWFVLPRLSIGANATISASLRRTRERLTFPVGPATVNTTTGFGFSAGTFGLTGAVFF